MIYFTSDASTIDSFSKTIDSFEIFCTGDAHHEKSSISEWITPRKSSSRNGHNAKKNNAPNYLNYET